MSTDAATPAEKTREADVAEVSAPSRSRFRRSGGRRGQRSAPPGATTAKDGGIEGVKATPSTPKTRTEYRPDIDGIRGMAAIMVMGFHADVPGFRGAYIGLDLFFVVSGYVITGLLMSEHERSGKIRWGAFYARRARRLIPAKATMLIGVLILSYFIVPPTGSQQETARSAAAAAGFVSNFFFWKHTGEGGYFTHTPGEGVLLHTWSLAVEEQFYLAVPLALLISYLLARLLRQPPTRMLLFTTIALGIASVLLAISWAHTHPDAAYYLPMTRAFEFLIGVALALVARMVVLAEDLREVMGIIGAVLIAYCLWKPMPVEGYPSYWALIPCAAAVLMVWAGVDGPTAITRFLSNRLLVGLGLVSYGWYLWHWPFLVLGETENLGTPPLWARVALIFAALGVAILSYRYIEGLFYKRSGAVKKGTTWGSRRVVISGILSMACVAGLASGGVALADDKSRSQEWVQEAANATDYPDLPSSCLSEGQYIPDTPGKCVLTNNGVVKTDRPTVVLWGDSHAWMYIPALEAAAEKKDVNLVSFVMGACPPFEVEGATGRCAKSNEYALDYVRRMAPNTSAPVRVLLSASWETYRAGDSSQLPAAMSVDYLHQISGYFNAGAPQLFSDLAQLNIGVDVVGPTPIIPRNAPLCEARSRLFSCDVPRSEAIVDESQTLAWLNSEMVGLQDKSRLIDVTPQICDDDTCFAESNGIVNYFDDNHLSATLARKLKSYFLPTFRAVTKSADPA